MKLRRPAWHQITFCVGDGSRSICRRPLRGMPINQERLYHAGRLIEDVSLYRFDYASCAGVIDYFDLMELVGRLDLVVEGIRSLNGASN